MDVAVRVTGRVRRRRGRGERRIGVPILGHRHAGDRHQSRAAGNVDVRSVSLEDPDSDRGVLVVQTSPVVVRVERVEAEGLVPLVHRSRIELHVPRGGDDACAGPGGIASPALVEGVDVEPELIHHAHSDLVGVLRGDVDVLAGVAGFGFVHHHDTVHGLREECRGDVDRGVLVTDPDVAVFAVVAHAVAVQVLAGFGGVARAAVGVVAADQAEEGEDAEDGTGHRSTCWP